MTYSTIIAGTQVLNALCWVPGFVIFAPSFWRWLTYRRDDLTSRIFDRGLMWLLCASQVGFMFRWSVYRGAVDAMTAGELTLWAGCYVFNALVGAALTVAVVNRTGGVRHG